MINLAMTLATPCFIKVRMEINSPFQDLKRSTALVAKEFNCLLKGISDIHRPYDRLKSLEKKLSKQHSIAIQMQITITVSIGISSLQPGQEFTDFLESGRCEALSS